MYTHIYTGPKIDTTRQYFERERQTVGREGGREKERDRKGGRENVTTRQYFERDRERERERKEGRFK